MSCIRHHARHSSGKVPVYYDYFEPGSSAFPVVVMIHGGTQTGSCFLRTIDGRPGWAYYFANQGYPVAVPDWPGSGRSCYLAPEFVTGEVVCQGLASVLDELKGPIILLVHSMAGAYGWHLAGAYHERIRAIVAVAPAPPGEMQAVPKIESETETEIHITGLHRPMTLPKGDFVADRAFAEGKLIGTSRLFPPELGEKLFALMRPIPRKLLYERWNVDGSQVTIGDTSKLRNKPILVVTGTEDLDHHRDLDSAVVKWLNEVGATADFYYLADHGIVGNGHMIMLESNSDVVALEIIKWLAVK